MPPQSPISPIPDEFSQSFFEAAAGGTYLLRHCRSCARICTPWAGVFMRPRQSCPFCLSTDVGWYAASGRGTLFSFGIVHQTTDPAFADLVPYDISLVALQEGVTVLSTVVDCPNDELEIGMQLELVFSHPDYAVPVFRPIQP